MLNNQDIWCPYSVAIGSSSGGSGESSITVDFALSETSENPVANKTITAALNEKADTTHTHTANEVGADASGSAASALVEAKAYTDSEIADAMAENQTVVEALDATIGTKANKTDIPTKVSELENDSGYLTEHQDLSEYAKTADVPNIKVNEAANAYTVNGHSVNADVPDNAKFTDTIPDLSPYAKKTDIPTELPANGGNADYATKSGTVDSLRIVDNYSDIFSTTLTDTHPCWNKKCSVQGQSQNPNEDNYIENAPETTSAVWYEVETIGAYFRAYQIARGCFTHQRKSFIRYMHDGVWSGWNDIYTSGNKPYVNGSVTAKYGERANVSFGFTPSMVLYRPASPKSNMPGSIYEATINVDDYGFTPNQSTYNQEDSCGFVYIAFR